MSKISGRWLMWGAVLVVLATVGGAFGAHALETRLAPDKLDAYNTAMRYLHYQGLGLCALSFWAGSFRRASPMLALHLGGTVLFCGSIVLLVLAPQLRFLGPVTPVGGLLLIAAWGLVAHAAWMGTRNNSN